MAFHWAKLVAAGRIWFVVRITAAIVQAVIPKRATVKLLQMRFHAIVSTSVITSDPIVTWSVIKIVV